MKKNLIRTLIIASLLALLVLAACGPQAAEEPADEPAEQPAGGDEEPAEEPAAEEPAVPEVQGSISADVVLDPANTGGNADADNLAGFVYETLADLATSWNVSDDGLTYTFNLRPDVGFHDGTVLDADAVIANFNRWFDPASELRGSGDYAVWLNYFGGFHGDVNEDGEAVSLVDGIEKQDDLTVLVHLNRPDEGLPGYLSASAFAIVSPAALAAGGDSYGAAGSAVAGTGAYMVQEWSADSLVLAPFGDYWGVTANEAVEFSVE